MMMIKMMRWLDEGKAGEYLKSVASSLTSEGLGACD